MKRNSKLFHSTRYLTTAAMMTALSVLIGIFCKNFLSFGTGPFSGLFRVTFENLPILAASVLLGPVAGAVVGGASDLISYLLSRQVYPPNLIVTAGAITVGLVAGVCYHYLFRRLGYKARLILSSAAAHLLGSMIIKPFGLYQFYGILVLWRIPLYLVIAPIEIFLLYKLLSIPAIKRLFDVAK